MASSIVSTSYTIRRMELSLTTARIYVLNFWWMLIGIPIAGVIDLLVFHQLVFTVIGCLMVLWPLTIPARATLVTARRWRKIAGPATAEVTDDAVFIRPKTGVVVRVGFDWMRRVRAWGDLFVLEGRGLRFALIKASAFSLEDRIRLEADFVARGLLHR